MTQLVPYVEWTHNVEKKLTCWTGIDFDHVDVYIGRSELVRV